MPEKPSAPIFNEVFGHIRHSTPKPEPDPTVSEEAHVKLRRNLDLALNRHHDFMTADQVTAGDKRLALEAANTTVKAALTSDRTALKARNEKTIERVLLRLLFLRRQRGYALSAEDEKMLKTAPRAELEAALGSKLKEYDEMEAAAALGEPLKPPPSPPEPPRDDALQEALTRAFGR
jgi:hypothetical protein